MARATVAAIVGFMREIMHDGDRVRAHTAPQALHEIDQQIDQNIRYYADQPPEIIERRLAELDQEWDVERILEANASTLALTGVALAALVSKKWLYLTGGVLGFLLLHSVQGWCPPLPVLRRMGVRTQREIERERYALKALRGDFDNLGARESSTSDRTRAEAASIAVLT